MQLLKLKRVWLFTLIAIAVATVSSCGTTGIILKTAPNSPSVRLAEPVIKAQSILEWERQKPLIDAALQRNIYGTFPESATITSVEKTPLLSNIYPKQARAEAWSIAIDLSLIHI